jgi:bifunctional non-homologous end joining protein LigD
MATPELRTYNAKRDFSRTSEPRGRPLHAKKSAPRFVVQKHDASRLHYDFRLEVGGVLKSWAVPKGPSLDPKQRRLAVEVEDHPLDYGDFEGTIPEGQYGGGTVMLWDHGTWTPEEEPLKALRKGTLHFRLDGQRLKGEFILTRLKRRPKEKRNNWLLIKRSDDAARTGSNDKVVRENVTSVATGRDLDGIAAGNAPKGKAKKAEARQDKVETLKKKAPGKARRKPAAAAVRLDPGAIAGSRHTKLPRKLAPQLATLTEEVPEGKEWLSEIKFDGYRMLARIERGKATIWSRNGLDWTRKLPHLVPPLEGLGLHEAYLDGEVVSLDGEGRSNFGQLKSDLSDGRSDRLFYYLFDLPYLDGHDLRRCRLTDRKAALKTLLQGHDGGALRFSDHVEGSAEPMRAKACAMHLEGIICKRADARYESGRSKSWLKVKCIGREEFVILGFTEPSGSREGLGSLHLGYYDGEGALHYAGGVGTGFDRKTLTVLRRALDGLEVKAGPSIVFHAGEVPKGIRWVKPKLVVEVQYGSWTPDKILRHSIFLGLRDDKSAEEVVREVPEGDADPGAPAIVRRPGARIIVAKKPPKRPAARGKAAKSKRSVPTIIDARDTDEGDVRLTHPDRVLWPDAKITKADLAAYWRTMADAALPHIADRPLALVRCPDGAEGQCFFQKHASPGFPKPIKTVRVGKEEVLIVEDADGLVALAQMSVLEIHLWGSHLKTIEKPDQIVIDLDPDEGLKFARVVEGAHAVRKLLGELGLESFCKSTGGKGLHVVAPLKPVAAWPEVKAFTKAVAAYLESSDPETYVAVASKRARKGHVFVDYLRNGRGATAIAPFSPRARPEAAVATPLAWSEVTASLDPRRFTMKTVPARITRQKRDPWTGFFDSVQTISAAARKTLKLR